MNSNSQEPLKIEWKPSIEQHDPHGFEFMYVNGVHSGNICHGPRFGQDRWFATDGQTEGYATKEEAKAFVESKFVSPPALIKATVEFDGNGSDEPFKNDYEFAVGDVEAYHGVKLAEESGIQQISLAEDYALYTFHRRFGDNRELLVNVRLPNFDPATSAKKEEGSVSQFVKRVFTENTGGGCMVDFIELTTGQIIGLNDESVVLYPNMNAFYEGDEGNFDGFGTIHRSDAATIIDNPRLGTFTDALMAEYTVDLLVLSTGEILGVDSESICYYANIDAVHSTGPGSVLATILFKRNEDDVALAVSKVMIFNSTASNAERGLKVNIVRPLTDQEADLDETGPMFVIQMEDGSVKHAFADELTPTNDQENEYAQMDDAELLAALNTAQQHNPKTGFMQDAAAVRAIRLERKKRSLAENDVKGRFGVLTVGLLKQRGFKVTTTTDAIGCTEIRSTDQFSYYNPTFLEDAVDIVEAMKQADSMGSGEFGIIVAGVFSDSDVFPLKIVTSKEAGEILQSYTEYVQAQKVRDNANVAVNHKGNSLRVLVFGG